MTQIRRIFMDHYLSDLSVKIRLIRVIRVPLIASIEDGN
jgi:hypothetical protein